MRAHTHNMDCFVLFHPEKLCKRLAPPHLYIYLSSLWASLIVYCGLAVDAGGQAAGLRREEASSFTSQGHIARTIFGSLTNRLQEDGTLLLSERLVSDSHSLFPTFTKCDSKVLYLPYLLQPCVFRLFPVSS